MHRYLSIPFRTAKFQLREKLPRLLLAVVGSLVFSQLGLAQQNLFNVPSGTVTRKDEVFLQQQMNLGRFGESNTTIDYGLGNDWEVGINIFKVNLYPGNLKPLPGESNEDALLVNIQKGFRPFETLTFEIGCQNGLSANNGLQKVDYLNFNWAVSRWTPESSSFQGTLVSGLYYGNTNFLGAGNEVGWMTGFEYPIFCEEFRFVADYISGTNSASVAVIGAQWTLSEKKGWQVSLGAQLPSPGSGNDYGAVFELTKFPPSFGKALATKL